MAAAYLGSATSAMPGMRSQSGSQPQSVRKTVVPSSWQMSRWR